MPRPRQKANTLIFNGDLSYQPAFVAEMDNPTINAWIDGTATGSLTDDQYKWNQVRDAGGMAFKFDQSKGYNAIKVRTTNDSGRGRVVYGSNSGSNSTQSINMLKKYSIPVLPNTSYTITYDIETENIIAAGSGARLVTNIHNASGVRVAIPGVTNGIKGTTTKVPQSTTFTTPSDGIFLLFYLEISTAGAAEQIAWFSNIKVYPTAGLLRTRTEARTLEGGNRFKVNDYGTAYDFGGTANIKKTSVLDGFATRSLLSFSLILNQRTLVTTNVAASQQTLWGTAFGGGSYLYCSLRNSLIQFRYVSLAGSDVTVSVLQRIKGKIKIAGTIGADLKLRIYINGVLVGTSAALTSVSDLSVPDVTLGLITGQANLSDASMDDFRLWRDVELSASEIAALHFNNRVPQKEKMIIEWLLNEGSGTIAIDTSGNGNDGTITPGASGTYTTDVFCVERTKVI